MVAKLKEHKLKKKRYGTLFELRNEILDSGIEKVVEYNGYRIVTNRASYGLFDGEVSITVKGK